MRSAEDMVRGGATVEEITQWMDHHLSGSWFTGNLMRLISQADPLNRHQIEVGFPHEVKIWNHWMGQRALTGTGSRSYNEASSN